MMFWEQSVDFVRKPLGWSGGILQYLRRHGREEKPAARGYGL